MKLGITQALYNAEVRNRRLQLGLSQLELAKKAGLDAQAVGRVETLRIVNPKAAVFLKLAAFFGVAPTDLCPEWLKLVDGLPKKRDVQADVDAPQLEGMVKKVGLLPAPKTHVEEVERDEVAGLGRIIRNIRANIGNELGGR